LNKEKLKRKKNIKYMISIVMKFTKISCFFKNSIADLIKDDNFLYDIAKYWLYSIYKVSSRGKYEEIKEKIIIIT